MPVKESGWKWEEPGDSSDHDADLITGREREGSFQLQSVSKVDGESLSSSHPSEEPFLRELGLFYPCWEPVGSEVSVQRRWYIHHRRPEWHIFMAATPGTEKSTQP